jgi:hypothetical protein
MPEPSATLAAHLETLGRLRADIDAAYEALEPVMAPVAVGRRLQDALNGCDQMERIGREWEAELDRKSSMLDEANRAAEDGG